MKLVIAEKPSVAQAIAHVLGATARKDGYTEGGGWLVSWCVGHLVGLAPADAYDPRYSKWAYDDLPIVPECWQFAADRDKEKQLAVLRALMGREDVDAVVCATDAGREGQLIFQLVYDFCGCKKPTLRLWISSMEETAIKEGFAALKDGAAYDSLYRSALCRAQADWLIGINATRLFSVLYGATLNVGRVQSPTLALLVNREAEIAGFKKQKFYTVLLCAGGFTAEGDRLADKKAAEDVRAACGGKTATVEKVEKKERAELPPKLYDLTTLQREANRLHGFTAQQTLDYTQSLYEKRLVTYPRTDSRYLTEDMAAGLPSLVEAVAGALPFMEGLETTVNAGRVVDGSKVSDHHAIIPTPSMPGADLAALPAGEKAVLFLIAARLLCAVGEKYVTAETVAALSCGGHTFTAKGRTVTATGWKSIDNAFRATLKEKPDDGKEAPPLPDLAEGQAVPRVNASVREGTTAPPKHYTDVIFCERKEWIGIEERSSA